MSEGVFWKDLCTFKLVDLIKLAKNLDIKVH